jgi:hypothetical protein
VTTRTDREHCGACGNVCSSGQVCSNGACTLTCAANLQTCSGGGDAGTDAGGARYCADPQTDRNNCGTCGNTCPRGQICERGACTLTCAVGQTSCSGTCRDLETFYASKTKPNLPRAPRAQHNHGRPQADIAV